MGQLESTQSLNEFKSGLTELNTVNHFYFGSIQLWKSRAENQIFSKKISSSFINEKNEIMYERRKAINHPNIMKLLYFDKNIKQSNIDLFWEYPGEIALQQLNNDETTIWKIIDQIVQGCSTFQTKNFYHGDIKPENIFFLKDRIILAESTLIPGLQNGYQKFISQQSFSFLSPQELESAKKKELKPKCDHYKSDVFSFGMTILELLTRQNSLDCYDFQNFSINSHVLHQRLSSIVSDYSQCLLTFLHLILQPRQEERPTFIDLNKMMENLHAPIQQNQPFYHDFVFCNCDDHTKHKTIKAKVNNATQTEEFQQQVPQIPMTIAKSIIALVINPTSGEVLGEINLAEPAKSQYSGTYSPQSLNVNPSPQRILPNLIDSSPNKQFNIQPQKSPQYNQEQLKYSPQQFQQPIIDISSQNTQNSPFKQVSNYPNNYSPNYQQQFLGNFTQQHQQALPPFQNSPQRPMVNQLSPSISHPIQYQPQSHMMNYQMHPQQQNQAHFDDNLNYSMVKDYTNKELERRVEKAMIVSRSLLEKLDYQPN